MNKIINEISQVQHTQNNPSFSFHCNTCQFAYQYNEKSLTQRIMGSKFDLFCLHWSSSASTGHAAGGASQMQAKWIKLDLESNNEEGI